MDGAFKFGVFQYHHSKLGISPIGSIEPIDDNQFLGVTTHELYIFDQNQIQKSFKIQLSCAAYIAVGHGLIVAHSQFGGYLYIFSVTDLTKPLLKFSSNQIVVSHIIFSPISNAVITYGSGIKIWSLTILYDHENATAFRPYCELSLRAEILPSFYETSLLTVPPFDKERELLILILIIKIIRIIILIIKIVII